MAAINVVGIIASPINAVAITKAVRVCAGLVKSHCCKVFTLEITHGEIAKLPKEGIKLTQRRPKATAGLISLKTLNCLNMPLFFSIFGQPNGKENKSEVRIGAFSQMVLSSYFTGFDF